MKLYKHLNFDKVLDLFSPYFHVYENKVRMSSLDFLSKEELKLNLEYLQEFNTFYDGHRDIDILDIDDLSSLFIKINKEERCEIKDFFTISSFLKTAINIKNGFSSLSEKEFPNILNEVLDLHTFPHLIEKYSKSFDSIDHVSDSASSTLKQIRSDILIVQSSISSSLKRLENKYKDILVSSNSFKDGQNVLAVNTSYVNDVDGIVLSSSKTKMTSYVLPKEVIILQNKLDSLFEDEKEEISKIIHLYCLEIKNNLLYLQRDYKIVKFVDWYTALIKCGIENEFSIPQLSENKISFNGLFHPFISKHKCVTNSYFLDQHRKYLMILSGPNSGGKSVLFKSSAICVLLFMLGFPVNSTKQSELCFVDNVFTILGDDESVTDNLSKFTSHLVAINNILDKVTKNSFVVIDEICSGTSPEYGEALGFSFIMEFIKIHCFSLFSTHYEGVKQLGREHSAIVNASMQFDSNCLVPTYKLIINSVGSSYTFEACDQVKVKKHIINRAREYMKDEASSSYTLDKMSKKLDAEIEKNKLLNKKVEEKTAYLNTLIEKKEKELNKIENLKLEINRNAENRISKLVTEKERELELLFSSTENQLDFKTYSKIKGKLAEIEKDEDKKIFKDDIKIIKKVENKHIISVGDYVIYQGVPKCKVLEIRNNKIKLDLDGMTLTTSLNNVEYDKNNSVSKVKNVSSVYNTKVDSGILNESIKLELNIIGLTKDEAMLEVDHYLSSCLSHHIHQVRIIHGMGSFVLKNELSKKLSKLPFVESFRSGSEGEGGLGATIVILK